MENRKGKIMSITEATNLYIEQIGVLEEIVRQHSKDCYYMNYREPECTCGASEYNDVVSSLRKLAEKGFQTECRK